MEKRTGQTIDIFSDSLQTWLYTPNHQTCPDFYQDIDDLISRFRIILYQKMNMHMNDPSMSQKNQDMVDLIAVNESVVRTVFDQLNSNEMEYTSEIFEEIIAHLNSQSLLDYFHTLQNKYPYIDMESDLFYAQKSLKINI